MFPCDKCEPRTKESNHVPAESHLRSQRSSLWAASLTPAVLSPHPRPATPENAAHSAAPASFYCNYTWPPPRPSSRNAQPFHQRSTRFLTLDPDLKVKLYHAVLLHLSSRPEGFDICLFFFSFSFSSSSTNLSPLIYILSTGIVPSEFQAPKPL